MKVFFILLCTFFYGGHSIAQDVILKRNNDILKVKIIGETEDQILYKFYNKLEDDLIYLSKKDISKISLENGLVINYGVEKSPEAQKKEQEQLLIQLEYKRKEDSIYLAHKLINLKNGMQEKLAYQNHWDSLEAALPDKKHVIFGEAFGMGGVFSLGYEARLFNSKQVSLYANVAAGFSNKIASFPHSIMIGLGSVSNQFILGVGGTYIHRMPGEEFLKDVFGTESKYLVYPVIGYRAISSCGVYFHIKFTPVISNDRYEWIDNDEGGKSWGHSNQWGISPWGSMGVGYIF